MSTKDKILKWWYFNVRNTLVRRGEAGAFKWKFKRFWLEIETISGNFRARFTAAEHPYAYLIAGKDEQTQGFAERLYMVGSLLTTDQKFVNDINKAIRDYEDRLQKAAQREGWKDEADLAFVKSVQEYIELPKKERRKVESSINKRFEKAVKNVKGQD